jgi:hypothetical protein
MRQFIQRLSVFLILLAPTIFGQYTISIDAPDQTVLDFSQIANLKNSMAIAGQKEFFSLLINKPDTVAVKLYGSLDWTDVDGANFKKIAEFITEPLTLTSLNNQMLGSLVKIKDSKSNSAGIDRNISKGKLVGEYTLTFCLYKATAGPNLGGLKDADRLSGYFTKTFKISNPTQTITITEPMTGEVKSFNDNIFISWTQVDGIGGYNGSHNQAYYWLKANKILPGETPDDALGRSSLYVNKKLENSSSQTSVSWQSVKNKDWSAGDNIVVAVSAIFPDGTELKGIPVFFTVANNAAGDGTQTGTHFNLQDHPINVALLNAINSLPASFLSTIPASFIQSLTNGTLILNSITVDGISYSAEQLQALMEYLMASPSLILSIALSSK